MCSNVSGTPTAKAPGRFRLADVASWRIRSQHFLILLLAFALVASLPAFSQTLATGSLSGTVTDPSGAVVAGAKVTATNVGTNLALTTTSNNVGYWALRAVPTGSYRVAVETPNFQKLEIAGVEVTANKEMALGSMKLALARGTEVVEVREAAPLMETTTSQVSSSFATRQVAELPLGGGFDALALFIPGVADTGINSFSNSNGASFSSNGLRGRSNNFQIDGQSNNDNSVAGPSIFMGNEDAIGEVNVITNNFGVEYGRNSGSVVNYVTKSGTNSLHGTVFEFNRNSIWDSHTNQEKSPVFGFCPPGVAVGTLINVVGQPDPNGSACSAVEHPSKYIDNRYGGSLGGPIVKNRVWFFGSYMEEKTRTTGSPSNSGSLLTPTPAGLATLAATYPGNPAVAALQAIGPYAVLTGVPTIGGKTKNVAVTNGVTPATVQFAPVTRNVPSVYNDWELVGKVDAQITNKDRLTGRYVFQKNIFTGYTGQFAAGAWVDVPAKDQQIALDWVRTISSNVVNQARFSYSRAGFGFEGGSFPQCTDATILSCPTGINFADNTLSFGMQNNLPQGRLINNSQWQDNASWVRGRHTFKFGGEYDRQRSPNTFLPNINGTYTFNTFNDFLANNASLLNLTDGPPNFNFKEQDIAFYGGDDWRIKDNLTLNLGLRWEFSTQAINLLHALSVATQTGSTPNWDTTLPLSITTVHEIPNVYSYFAPNVGFAWTPKGRFLGDGKTVIRGGARIAYDPAFYNMFLNVATAAPTVNAGSLTTCPAPCLPTTGFTGADVRTAHLPNIPRGGNPGARNYTIVSPDFHEPRTYLWSFGVEREITSKVVFETRYVGNHVTGQFQTLNANPRLDGLLANGFGSFIPAGITPCATPGTPGFATGRENCDFTNVRERANTAWSYYHGWQNQLRVSAWHGVTAGVSYTWSKTMDNNTEIFSTGQGGNAVAGAQNPFDWSKPEKAESGISFPHTASIYLTYDLPFYRSQKGFIAHLLGGYGFNTTWRYSSGQLWTPVESNSQANSSCQTTFDRAFFGSSLSTCRPFWSNPAAPLDTMGKCTNAAASDCGLVDYFTGTPIAASAVRFIFNNNAAAAFFGTPYGNVGRDPGLRGESINNVNLTLYKSTKIAERVDMKLEAQVYNLMNRQFRGVPDVRINHFNFGPNGANGGSYGNTFFNDNGGVDVSGNSYTSATVPGGIGRRVMILGAKFTF